MRLIKAKAKELMFSGENHLLLIFSLVIIGASLFIPQLIFAMIYAFYPYLWVDIALAVFTFLLAAPLLCGLLRMVWRSANGERCTIADLFEPFCTPFEYFRSVLITLLIAAILAAEVLIIIVPEVVTDMMLDTWIAHSVGFFGSLIVLFGLLVLNSRIFIFPMLAAGGEKIFPSIAHSFRLTKGKTFRLLGYRLGFFPLLIVSILGVLVPLIIYTAPYMLCAYAIGVKTMCENNKDGIVNYEQNRIQESIQ